MCRENLREGGNICVSPATFADGVGRRDAMPENGTQKKVIGEADNVEENYLRRKK